MPYRSRNPMLVLPKDLKPNDILAFRVVAVIGPDKSWTAYRGYSSWSDEEIAARGDKISKKAAEELFSAPKLAGLVYHG
jgi:hypothetical protein